MKHLKALGIVLGLVVVLTLAVSLTLAQGPGPAEQVSPQGEVSVQGTVSSKISYQGVLRENGNPVNGTRTITFTLYSDDTCATEVDSIVKSGVPITNGLFSVELNVNHDDFNGQSLWLGVEVDGTTVGCQEILPVPYALSLKPGAVISDSDAYVGVNYSYSWGQPLPIYANVYGLYAETKGNNITAWYYGVYGSSESDHGYGGFFKNSHSSGAGLYAIGGSDSAADLVLGANSDTNDNGVIASDPNRSSSDIVLKSNDNVRIDLDNDQSGEDADFEIYDKDDNLIFDVDESGDVSQPLTADGLVKAAVYANCRSSGSSVFRSFNRVNGQAITIANGTSAGRCSLTFNFDLSSRFWVAMPAYTGAARTVSCEIDAGNTQKLNCARFDVNGNGVDGNIMVLVY